MTSDELIANFELLGSWEERYRYLIELGQKMPEFPESMRTDENKVRGCMSQVWMISDIDAGDPARIHFRGDSDAHIVRGLIAILLQIYSGRSPEEILNTDIEGTFRQLGLEEHISVNRRNGFFSMVEKIRSTAAEQAGVGATH